MNPLYNTGLQLYRLGARIAASRSPKIKKMVDGQSRVFSYLSGLIRPGERWIWIHAASLGEFEQGRPLIEMIKEREPEAKILLTFFSPSGYEVRKDYDRVNAVCYLPFDTPALSRRFLDAVNPSMAIFIKYEFWGNYLTELRRRAIPTYLVSAIFRRNQPFFKWWGGWFRDMLHCFTQIYVQDRHSVELLASIGIKDVRITGDTRLDRVSDIKNKPLKTPSLNAFTAGSHLTFIAGSSWEPDEDIYIPWLNSHPEVKAIIAPHEFDPARLARLKERVDGRALFLSEWSAHLDRGGDVAELADVRAVIVDCFGQLSSLYRLGDIAYIGGGFGKGIHNINEAAVYGIPVVFGPHHAKFKEATDLIRVGGAFSAPDAPGITLALDRLLADSDARGAAGKAASSYIASHIGATAHIFNDIFPPRR